MKESEKKVTFELLYRKIMKELSEPKTLDEIMKIFPNENRDVVSTELGRLRKNNFVTKIGKKYQLHPVYVRQNNL